jgi:dynein light intermediate chain 1
MQTGERKRFDEDSEFIQKHIRNLALFCKHDFNLDGASVIYTSTKQNINLNILYDYILHRIYKFDLIHRPNLMDKDAYFIPSGYDNLNVLKSTDINNDLAIPFEERIVPVKPKAIIREEEIFCEDVNNFLSKFKNKVKSVQSTTSAANKPDYTSNTASSTTGEFEPEVKPISAGGMQEQYKTEEKPNFGVFLTNSSNRPASKDKYATNANPRQMINLLKDSSTSKLPTKVFSL